MVKTGRRATALRDLLTAGGLQAAVTPASPRLADLSPDGTEIVRHLYESFGGRLDPAGLRSGPWDLAFDGLLVELDEELHFNRYRAHTLAGQWADALPWTTTYREFCVDFEERCIAAGSWGNRWTNPSCARHFGDGDPPKVFGHEGAPRWKQRALYDAIKDAYALSPDQPRLARISIYDQIGNMSVGDVLDGRATTDAKMLVNLLRRRTNH